MKVKEVMTPNPYTVTPQAQLKDALSLMVEHSIRHVPVLEKGELVGMLSDRDIRQSASPLLNDGDGMSLSDEGAILNTPVSEVMATTIHSIDQDSSVTELIDLMIEERIAGIPVLSKGKLTGIVTYIDLLLVMRDLLSE